MRKHNKNHNRPSHSQPEAVRMAMGGALLSDTYARQRSD